MNSLRNRRVSQILERRWLAEQRAIQEAEIAELKKLREMISFLEASTSSRAKGIKESEAKLKHLEKVIPEGLKLKEHEEKTDVCLKYLHVLTDPEIEKNCDIYHNGETLRSDYTSEDLNLFKDEQIHDLAVHAHFYWVLFPELDQNKSDDLGRHILSKDSYVYEPESEFSNATIYSDREDLIRDDL